MAGENRLEALRDEMDKIILRQPPENIRMYLSHMYGVARFCTLLALKRGLDVELATTCGMLHDIGYMSGGPDEGHAPRGAKQAEELLQALGLYREEEIALITAAIARHSDKEHTHGPYDELLKDADVMDHWLYNTAFPGPRREEERRRRLRTEFGLGGAE